LLEINNFNVRKNKNLKIKGTPYFIPTCLSFVWLCYKPIFLCFGQYAIGFVFVCLIMHGFPHMGHFRRVIVVFGLCLGLRGI